MSRFAKRWSLYLVPLLFAWIIYGVVERREPTITEFAQRFCAGVAYETSGDMEQDVDTRWITVADSALGSRAVTDRRTGFSVDQARLAKLAHCEAEITRLEDGLLLERLCDVMFVVSPDWKIRAIMDEATWEARGDEILAQVRGELKQCCGAKEINPGGSEGSTGVESGDSGGEDE